MKNLILAAAAVLSLGVGSAYAASYQARNAQETDGSSIGTHVTTTANGQQYSPVFIGPEPNPWQGTESWAQWNQDHPPIAGGN